jgi:hypothetical protein
MFCVLFNFTVSHISPQGHLKLPCGPIRKGPHWWETDPYREECSMGASMQPIRHCMGGTVCRASTGAATTSATLAKRFAQDRTY